MTNPNTSIIINSGALVQKVGDEIVILDAQSGQYYALNEMATEMLEKLQKGATIAATAIHICTEYDVDENDAITDITEMVDSLFTKKLASPA